MARIARDGLFAGTLTLSLLLVGCSDHVDKPRSRSPAVPQSEPVETLPDDAWVSLFNGRDLSGWEHLGGGKVGVRDGLIQLENDGSHRPGYLATRGRFRDFQARFRCKVVGGDSGLFFRARRDPNHPEGLLGPQVQLHPLPDRGLGGLFETQGRGWLLKPGAAVVSEVLSRADWLDGELMVRGSTVRVVLNGVVTAEWSDDQGLPESGCLAIQMHGAGCRVVWASLEVRAAP